MARQIAKLTALAVSKLKKAGYYGDGSNLWLQVSPSGSKSWVFRYMLNGKPREMGLGPLRTIDLATARRLAADSRRLLLEKIDPIADRDARTGAASAAAAKSLSFDECARQYIASHRTAWKNAKHADQWQNTLKTYASPVFGSMPISAVDTGLVMQALERDRLWTEKTETASRLRGRIERVLGWATVRSYRSGDNPARWRGHLDALLPRPTAVTKREHHDALAVGSMGNFMADLRQRTGIAVRALEFSILTAARSGEVMGAKWSEVNLTASVWTVPAERMKAAREHRVPLSKPALELLKKLPRVEGSEFVFPADDGGQLSNNALLAVVKRIGADCVPHGFRSTFRDWAAERTGYPREVAEMALAHAIGDKVEAAYRRGDLFEKRRRMMADWAVFCAQRELKGAVVPIRRRRAA